MSNRIQNILGKSKDLLSNPTAIFIGVSILGILGLATAAVLFLNPSTQNTSEVAGATIVTTEGDTQVISVKAKAGFTPSNVTAAAHKSTILKVSTKDTYDCSNTLIFPSLKKQVILPPNGSAEVTIPAQESGTKITATCSMGMYNLELNFL